MQTMCLGRTFFQTSVFVLVCCVQFLEQQVITLPYLLRQVNVVARHGDRAPDIGKVYPCDPYNDISFWPNGWGELLNVGKLRAFQFGQFLRNKYYTFLAANGFNSSTVYVRSSDTSRTLMSAQLIMAGLYPPSGNEIWNKDLPWQPVPVHTVPKYGDWLNAHSYCPPLRLHLVKNYMEVNNEVFSRYPTLESHIRTCTGYEGIPLDLTYVINVVDAEVSNGLKLPKCIEDIYPEPLTSATGLQWKLGYSGETAKRLRGGPLLKSIVDNMQQCQQLTINSDITRFFLYSTHDTLIVSILIALEAFIPKPPVYSSAVIFELFENINNHEFYVKVSYFESINTEPTVFNVMDCGELCKLERFIELLNPIIPNDWNDECQQHQDRITNKGGESADCSSPTAKGPEIVTILLGCLCTGLVVIVIVMANKLKHAKNQILNHGKQKMDDTTVPVLKKMKD